MSCKKSLIDSVTVLLCPIDDGSEIEVLDPSFCRRPPLTLSYPVPAKKPEVVSEHSEQVNIQSSYPLLLGRNVLTRIHDTKLSRKLAILEFRDSLPTQSCRFNKPRLVMTVNQSNGTHRVYINGSRALSEITELFHNDEISLHGRKYKYRVSIMESGNSTSKPNPKTSIKEECAPSSKVSSIATSEETDDSSGEQSDSASLKRKQEAKEEAITDKIQATAKNHIIDELTCSICMEIIVQCHVANPCGHMFCKPCIDRIPSFQRKHYHDRSSCPSCRKEITSLTRMRCVDNIIWNFVLSGEIFGDGPHGEEDLKQFMLRCGKQNVNNLTDEQRACIFQKCKRQKRDDGDSSSEGFQIPLIGASSVPDHRHLFPFASSIQMISTAGRYSSSNPVEIDINESAGTVEDPICLDD